MKIGIVGDVHYSQYSSILRSRGKKYSTRLENLNNSLNWAEQTLKDKCDFEVYLGDFFDSDNLGAEVLTSLSNIHWNSLDKYLIVGNHEMWSNNLDLSSAHVLNMQYRFTVIDTPISMKLNDFQQVFFLPYILEANRKESITDYFTFDKGIKNILFSHNDIAGLQMGKFVSQSGFDLDDLESNFAMIINGHLHNGSKISDKFYNIGVLTGQNFSEDALKYEHHIFILDTDTLNIEVIPNPFAFNFVQVDATLHTDNVDVLTGLKNAVVTVKCKLNNKDAVEEKLKLFDVITSRLIIVPEKVDIDDIADSKIDLSVNHLNEFYDFVLQEIGTDNLTIDELNKICKERAV